MPLFPENERFLKFDYMQKVISASKKFIRAKASFGRFIVVVLALFLLVIMANAGRFYWFYRDLSRQNITVLTQNTFASGGSGSLQIYAQDAREKKDIEHARIAVSLLDNEKNEKITDIFEGELTQGRLIADFKLPALDDGKYDLKIAIESDLGRDEIEKTIEVVSEPKIIIATDRPLYKPGQNMNFRILALNKNTLKPMANEEIIVAIKNPKGDKVWQKKYTTSAYGIVSDEFGFAAELSFGQYVIEAGAGDQTAEKIVEVKYFTLPKFEVEIMPDQDLSRPQNTITGKILAKYFFGQPVTGADTVVTLAIDQLKSTFRGKTDNNGFLDFFFSGPSARAPQKVSLTAEVTDENGFRVEKGKTAAVKDDTIQVELVPESGKLKPGLDNEILFISSRADGTPVKTLVFMTGESMREFATNEFGIAKFTYRPDQNISISRFTLNIRDEQGNALTKAFNLQNETSDRGYLILRTDKTLYDNDKTVGLEVYSTSDQSAQIEFVQDGRIMLTDTVVPKDGFAAKEIELPDNLFGTVEVRAVQTFKNENNPYRGNRDRDDFRFVSDSKMIIVDQAKDLRVGIELDKKTYLPGSEAMLTFSISNDGGQPENSAVGLKIVDKALLALENDDDNLSKLLFLVDEKVRKNARSINGLDWEGVLTDDTLVIKNNILQAMLLGVPREKISLSKTAKDNTQSWQGYEAGRRSQFRTVIMLLLAVWFAFVIRFWWQITAYASRKKITGKVWGSSALVGILTVVTATFFVVTDRYYYGFMHKAEQVFAFILGDLFESIAGWPYLFYLVLAVLFGICALVWTARHVFLDKFKPMTITFLAIFSLFALFSMLEKLDAGLSTLYADFLWYFALNTVMAVLFLGGLFLMAIRAEEENDKTVWFWFLVFMIGFLSPLCMPALFLIYPLLVLFGIIRAAGKEDGGEDDDIEARIEKMEKSLREEGRSKEAIELEMLLLRRDLEKQNVFTKIGRLVTWGLILFAGVVGLFFIFSILSSLGHGVVAPQPYHSSFDSGGINFATGDPRAAAVSVVKLIMTFAGLAAAVLALAGGIRRLSGTGSKARANSMIIIGIIGLILILMAFLVTNFVVTNISSSLSDDFSPRSYSPGPGLNSGGGGGLNFGASLDLGTNYVTNEINFASGDPRSALGGLSNILGSGEKETTMVAPKIEQGEIVVSQTGSDSTKFKQAERVRRFFPETMFWQSELIAENGRAEITVPIKDSITSWRLSALANSLSGKVGSGETDLVTYQDFFVDFDLPVNLTEGDGLVLPVRVFNYLSRPQKVKLVVRQDPWFNLSGPNERIIALGAGETATVDLGITLEKFGDFVMRIDAEGTSMADAMEKTVTVLPYGQRITQTVTSERLKQDKLEAGALFPDDTIPGTARVIVRIYPSVFAQMVDGLESMLRLPNGCFEQTSSSLYPNILILKYLQRTGRDLPEIRKTAEDYISRGVQKLLTYELEPGGFSYFGGVPAETVLSAYGLMEFSEMRDVVFVDDNLIKRTADFLYGRQNQDGSFKMTGYHQGGFSGGNELAKNAYIIWALSAADAKDQRLAKSINYLRNHLDEIESSPYALALAANAFVNCVPDEKYTAETVSRLKQKLEVNDKNEISLKMRSPSHFGSYGPSGDIEVSALAAMAFARAGELDFSQKLTDYIVSRRYGQGGWNSTQATILALKALVENETASKVAKNNQGELTIALNDGDKRTLTITPENSEVVQYVIFEDGIADENKVSIEKNGKIDATLQIIKDYYRQWDASTLFSANQTLEAWVEFGLNQAAWPAPATPNIVRGENIVLYAGLVSGQITQNAVAEVPIPAGFEVVAESLICGLKEGSSLSAADCGRQYPQSARAGVSRYEIKGDRVILYFDTLTPGARKLVPIEFTAKYPGSFKIMPARLYGYYDQSKEAWSRPIGMIEVK